MVHKIAKSLMVCLGLFGGLQASHDYLIPTNDPNITCKVTVLSKMETAKLLDLFISSVDSTLVWTNSVVVNVRKENPIKQLHERFMTVQVSLVNNSPKTITLKKDDYFDLMYKNKAFINKKEVLAFYPTGNWRMGLSAVGFVASYALLIAIMLMIDPREWNLLFIPGGLMALSMISFGFGVRDAVKYSSKQTELGPKPDAVEDTFEIPARGRFSDVFFLDLDLVDLNFFETNQVKLEYAVKD